MRGRLQGQLARTLTIQPRHGGATEKQLRASLSQGVIPVESTFQLRARVEMIMGSASTMRADRIARTEVARAMDMATFRHGRRAVL